ncbi:MAG: hypothetical protein ACKVQC_06930 [Elusimicrobiota bacterium]
MKKEYLKHATTTGFLVKLEKKKTDTVPCNNSGKVNDNPAQVDPLRYSLYFIPGSDKYGCRQLMNKAMQGFISYQCNDVGPFNAIEMASRRYGVFMPVPEYLSVQGDGR